VTDTNMKKPSGTIYKILFALLLALALVNITSCDNLMGLLDGLQGGSQGNSPGAVPSNPNDNNPQTTEPDAPPKSHYSDYDNFNPADYVIENESGKPDSEIAWLKDIIWFMYAENADVGEWTANYVKTNKVKTILSNEWGANGWIDPDQLDRFYLNENVFNQTMSFYKEQNDSGGGAVARRDWYTRFFKHETMHLIQYKSNAFKLMTGMRPDICAAADMLTEFLAWFYCENRYPGTDVSADMQNAVETQSKYMILATDPWEYDKARAKDPSLPDFIHSTPWFNNDVSIYAQHAFASGLVRESAITLPLRQANQEDMLKVARTLLACRDPKTAGVTDEALWTVFDALCKVATGDSKYLKLTANGGWGCKQDYFDYFQELIANWDEEYAAQ